MLKLGRGLHIYGYPAHRLEEALGQVCHRLGLEGQFFSMPTALFAAFGQGEEHRTYQIRVEPGGVDLGKLVRLDETRALVAGGRLDPEEGSRLVEAILASPPAYGPSLTTIAFTLASATACRFFGGGLREMAAAGVIGLVIGLLALVLAERPATARVFEALAAAVAGFLAVGAAVLAPPLVASLATLGGLIILVPGYGLTVAFTEIATRNLVSGTARLAGVGLTFLVIAFGVALGTRIGGRLFGAVATGKPESLPDWTLLVALLVVPCAFAVLFRADTPRRALGDRGHGGRVSRRARGSGAARSGAGRLPGGDGGVGVRQRLQPAGAPSGGHPHRARACCCWFPGASASRASLRSWVTTPFAASRPPSG